MAENNIINITDAEALEREAAQWCVRFDSGNVSDADKQSFQDWYGESQQHRDAFQRVQAFWGGAEILTELKDYAAADDLAELVEQDDRTKERRKVVRTALGAIAATLLAVSMVSFAYYGARSDGGDVLVASANQPHNTAANSLENFAQKYTTLVGEQQKLELPDGSLISLNTNSEIMVAFEQDARRIEMVRGEAFFQVAPDVERPFSVATNKGTVTAVGTAFSVRVDKENIDVLVTEGRVSLATVSKNESPDQNIDAKSVTEISAGQSIKFAELPQSIEIVDREQVEKALDWEDGVIAFNGETLEQVIGKLSRYTDLTIDISDDTIRQQKIVAYYRVGEIEPMFEALNLMAGIEVERVGERHVRLQRAD